MEFFLLFLAILVVAILLHPLRFIALMFRFTLGLILFVILFAILVQVLQNH